MHVRCRPTFKPVAKTENKAKRVSIVLAVTGSIAAHKAADLASQLAKAGANVSVVMTAEAQQFITPLPFKTLTRNPVVTSLSDEEEGWQQVHVRLADEAEDRKSVV